MSENDPPAGGSFAPPPGRRVLRSFVDEESGYLVVEHVSERGDDLHVALVDRRTATVLPIERRAREIGAGETVRVDAAHGLRVATTRTIDLRTGHETLHELLTDATSGVVLARGTSSALRPAGEARDILVRHLERRAEKEREAAFWRDGYPSWSFERRAAHFYDQIRRRIRSQEELGLDPYAMFTPETYAAWRAVEPEIDCVLDAVADRLDVPREVLDRRFGRVRPREKRRRRR